MTSKEASAKMEKIAKLAADESDKIFEVHNKEVAEVKRLLEHQIQWYQRGALGELHDVLKKATDTCNKRYVSLQSLVQMVDSECKPLLAYNPYRKSIKAVADIIADLNEDSVLNTDFGLSIDSGDMEDVAMVSYSPSLDALMIQKFWEQKVLVVDETPEEREALAAEKEKQRKIDDENRRWEEQKRKWEEEEERHAEEEKENRQREWKTACAEAEEKRRKWKEEKIAQKRTELDNAIENKHNEEIDSANKIITESQKQLEELRRKLDSLGTFAIFEKSKTKNVILALEKTIAEENKKIEESDKEYENAKKELPAKVKKYGSGLNPDSSGIYVPKDPDHKRPLVNFDSDHEYYKKILDAVYYGIYYSNNPISYAGLTRDETLNEAFRGYTNAQKKKIFKMLCDDGVIKEIKKGETSYYKAIK